MTKTIYTSVAAVLLGLMAVSAANAEARDPNEKALQIQSQPGTPVYAQPAPVIEGRNVYAAPQQLPNVEPYIERSVEQNARSR